MHLLSSNLILVCEYNNVQVEISTLKTPWTSHIAEAINVSFTFHKDGRVFSRQKGFIILAFRDFRLFIMVAT